MSTTTALEALEPDELRERAARAEAEAAASFERSDTDGFLSQWASGITADLYRRQAEIAEAGGVHPFPALYDLEGRRVRARVIDTRFGKRWAILDDAGHYAAFLPCHFGRPTPRAAAHQERRGFREGVELAPARALVMGSGKGLAGATSAFVGVIRTDDGYPEDAVLAVVSE